MKQKNVGKYFVCLFVPTFICAFIGGGIATTFNLLSLDAMISFFGLLGFLLGLFFYYKKVVVQE